MILASTPRRSISHSTHHYVEISKQSKILANAKRFSKSTELQKDYRSWPYIGSTQNEFFDISNMRLKQRIKLYETKTKNKTSLD